MDELTRNWVCDTSYRYRSTRNVNSVQSIRRERGAAYLTVAEFKTFARIDFADEDTLLDTFLKAATVAIENYTGLSLVPTTVTVEIQNNAGGIEFPYGPVIEDSIVLIDDDGTEVESGSWIIKGLDFPILITQYSSIRAEYDAGYDITTLPPDLKLAVFQQCLYLYENRGDGKMSETAKQLANSYKKIPWLL